MGRVLRSRLSFGERSAEIEVEECSFKIEFEEKRALVLGLVEALKSEIFIAAVNFGTSVDVGRISLVGYRAGIPPTLDLEEGEALHDM